ncbi:MAG TPA: hypothetical protein VFP32_02450, partial [Candidatus Saccharimonadales bacterium]|nr:hypothetical protein [Candidatus Saccharimonadales bacterium]
MVTKTGNLSVTKITLKVTAFLLDTYRSISDNLSVSSNTKLNQYKQMARKVTKQCPACKQLFTARRDAKTCSERCRKRMQRAIKALAAEAEVAKTGLESALTETAHAAEHVTERVEALIKPDFAGEGGFVGDADNAQTLASQPVAQANISQPEIPAPSLQSSSEPVAEPAPEPAPEPASEPLPSVPPTYVPPPSQPSSFDVQQVQIGESLEDSSAVSDSTASVSGAGTVISTADETPVSGALESEETSYEGPPHDYSRLIKTLAYGAFGVFALISSIAALIVYTSGHHKHPANSKQPDLSSLLSGAAAANSPNSNLHINFDTVIDNGKSLTATGTVLVQNEVDSTASFAVQNSAGSNLLVADTVNGRVGVGGAPTASNTAALQVTGNISTNGALVSTTNAYSLSNQGLSIGGVLICTSAGCTSANVPAPIDTSSFAKLASNQTFSGVNTFAAQLQAGGGINSLTPYQFNGSTGLTFSCPVGNFITEPTVQGGIITGGSCLSVGAGVTSLNSLSGSITLQGTANRVSVSNSAGTITFSTPQDIAITSAPTFAGLTLTNPLTVANGGLGTNTLPVNGAIPIGDGSNYSVSTLTAGSGISIVNGAGSITVSSPTAGTCPTCANQALSNLASVAINTSLLPQAPASIDLGSAIGTFRDLYLSGTAFADNLKRVNGASSTTLAILNPTATVTYQLQTAAAGTYDICTTAGNCVGAGGGVTTTGGTTNHLAKFVGSSVIGDSLITENGSLVSISVPLSTPSLQTTSGGVTNSLTFATPAGAGKTITIPNASGTVVVSASAPLSIDANGNISCPTCITSAVTTVNTFSGAISLQGTPNQVLLNNSAGTITFGTPQDIAITSAPTFAGLTLTNPLTVASGGLGANSAPVNGAIPIGNGSSYIPATLTAGTGISITNGPGSVTISTACPDCANTSLSNLTSVAINTSLLPQNPATIDLGSNALSFRDLYLGGTAYVNNLSRVDGANTTTLSIADPTNNVTYVLPAASGGPYEICTTAGNCGIGNAITGNGTLNHLAKFSSTNGITDSIITDDGTTVAIGGTLSVNTLTPTGALTLGATGQSVLLQGSTVTLNATNAGITNSLVFATPAASNKTITVPNATGTVAVSATGPISLD